MTDPTTVPTSDVSDCRKSRDRLMAIVAIVGLLSLSLAVGLPATGYFREIAAQSSQHVKQALEIADRAASAAEINAAAADTTMQALPDVMRVFRSDNESPMARLIVDENFLVLYATDGLERITGWSLTELQGRSALQLIPERYRGRHAGDSAVQRGAQPSGMVTRVAAEDGGGIVARDGSLIPGDVYVWPDIDSAGEATLNCLFMPTDVLKPRRPSPPAGTSVSPHTPEISDVE